MKNAEINLALVENTCPSIVGIQLRLLYIKE